MHKSQGQTVFVILLIPLTLSIGITLVILFSDADEYSQIDIGEF
jgi:hypothetical protein